MNNQGSPGTCQWLKDWAYNGSAAYASKLWEWIRTQCRQGERQFSAADWFALSARSQSRWMAAALAALGTERDAMNAEIVDEAARTERFIP